MPPGPALSAVLATGDLTRLSSEDVHTVLAVQARQAAHEQARSMAMVREAGMAAHQPPQSVRRCAPDKWAAEQIAWTLRLSRDQAEMRLFYARQIIDRLPVVWA